MSNSYQDSENKKRISVCNSESERADNAYNLNNNAGERASNNHHSVTANGGKCGCVSKNKMNIHIEQAGNNKQLGDDNVNNRHSGISASERASTNSTTNAHNRHSNPNANSRHSTITNGNKGECGQGVGMGCGNTNLSIPLAGTLVGKIMDYTQSGAVAMHMPGHKRNEQLPAVFPYSIDLTEIDGFDNLHNMQGVLRRASENASRVFGAKKTYFLINGSSGGILSAIYSQTQSGDDVVVARNSHKAVFNALEIAGLNATYILPKLDSTININGEIDAHQLDRVLSEKCDRVKCVIITSPTYEGIVSDVRLIADVCHRHNALLIVDEAHGAHLGFSADFPQSARALGADIVINSLHKTLPVLTQCAVLHACSDRVDVARLEKALAMFQTSSPSYVLMSSIDYCVNLLKEKGDALFADYSANLDAVYVGLSGLKRLKLLNLNTDCGCAFGADKGKLVVSTQNAGISGEDLANMLRVNFNIEIEMSSANYIIAMTSIADTPQTLSAFTNAIRAIDEQLQSSTNTAQQHNHSSSECGKTQCGCDGSDSVQDRHDNGTKDKQEESNQGECDKGNGGQGKSNISESKQREVSNIHNTCAESKQKNINISNQFFAPPCKWQISECQAKAGELVPLGKCVGCVALEYLWLYPPGIPLIVPGEIITADLVERLSQLNTIGLQIKSDYHHAPQMLYCAKLPE